MLQNKGNNGTLRAKQNKRGKVLPGTEPQKERKMRKEIRTNKMAKRAMALILTLAMVFGLAFTVYAEEDPQGEVEIEAAPEAEAAAEAEETGEAAVEVIDEAIAAVVADEITVVEIGREALEQLEESKALIEGTEEADGVIANLETAQEEIGNAVAANAAKAAKVAEIEEENDKADEAVNKANDSINTTNTTNSKEEAVEAKAAAEAEVEIAKAALNEAQTKIDSIQAAWEAADAKQAQAQAAADAALANAKENSTAALAALNAAKAQVAALENEKSELEAIKNQYYKMMVHYYRDGKIASAVYNADGSLNIEASAQKANADGKSVDPSYLNDNTYAISRELLRQLVTYKLVANGADPASISFAAEGKSDKKAAEGDLVKDNKGNDRVTISSSYNQKWDNVNGNSGRNHHAKVTYTDKDGNPVTEYYNYILKASAYNDETDLENGPIYLALVEYKDQAWTNSKDTDANNFDNYQKLTAAVEALQNYSAAKEAVDAAAAKVAELQAEVAALENVKIDDSELAALNQRLADAIAEKAQLEEAVTAAEEALAKIDFSRFEIVADEEDAEEETATAAAPVIASITPAVEVAQILPQIVPVAAVAAAVAATQDTGLVTLEDEVLPGAAAPAAEEVIKAAEEILPIVAAEVPAALTTLDENELPAAQFPENAASLWWVWLLILLMIAIVAYSIYKYNENKKEA